MKHFRALRQTDERDPRRPRLAGRDPRTSCEITAKPSVSLLAELGALVGDPARTNMLLSLRALGEMTARQLAEAAGVAPQTASGHLAKLTAAALVRVEKRGRYRIFRLGSDHVADLLDAIHVAGAKLNLGRTRPSVTQGPQLVRSCRDHMAGPFAAALAGAILDRFDTGPVLSRPGREAMARWGLTPGERGWEPCSGRGGGDEHVGGPLGAALMARSLALGWVRRVGPGELMVTLSGRRGFLNRFDIDLDAMTSADEAFLQPLRFKCNSTPGSGPG